MDVTMQVPVLGDLLAERGADVAIDSAATCKWRR
jgi:hypothetical protein